MSSDQSKGKTKTTPKCSSYTISGIFHCLLVGNMFALTFGPGNPLKPVIPTFPTSPYGKKSGQRVINKEWNTHSDKLNNIIATVASVVSVLCYSVGHRYSWIGWEEERAKEPRFEDTPCFDLFHLLLHQFLINSKRTWGSSRLISGSTAAPDHFQTARLRRTVGGRVWCLRSVPERRLLYSVAVFAASRQLPPDRSAFGPQNLTEKLELTETCKGIWPKGFCLLFFPKHQWRKVEGG